MAKLIIDNIVRAVSTHGVVSSRFWWLVAIEFILAVGNGVLGKFIDFLDSILADKFTRHVSVLLMKHAAELDLQAYEDAVFYDRLERARAQTTDRVGMIQSIGRLVQQIITAVLMSVSIMVFSPWLMLLLCAALESCPHFWGKVTSLFSATRRIFVRLRYGGNSTICAYWREARNRRKSSNCLV